MYLRFKKDCTYYGRSYKKDEVVYVTRHQKITENGDAVEVSYEEWHAEYGGKPLTTDGDIKAKVRSEPIDDHPQKPKGTKK